MFVDASPNSDVASQTQGRDGGIRDVLPASPSPQPITALP